MRTLKAGGADVVLCASNPLSTQDDVAAALVDEFDIAVFAIKGEDNDTYYPHIEAAVDHKPQLTMDDGADVIGVLHCAPARAARRHHRRHRGDDDRRDPPEGAGARRRARLPGRSPSTRRTRSTSSTTATARASRRSTGSSARRTSCSPASTFVVAGYGWCGRGVAIAREGHGRARDRHRGRPAARARGGDGRLRGACRWREAAEIGDIFVTATGDKHVITREHIERMKDGAILANTGHFNVEIDIPALRALATETREARHVRRGVHARGRPAASTCSPTAGSSTSPPPRVTRRR